MIGVLGDDPFGSYLDDAVRGERVNGRPLKVERYRRLDDVKTCHILFISKSEASRLKQDIDGLKAKPILTVSEINDFARKGGIIQFVGTRDGKIRLRINVDAAKAARLTISSKLLRPAEKIGGEEVSIMSMRDVPIRRKLMSIMLLITAGAAVLLTCASFFVYEVLTFR